MAEILSWILQIVLKTGIVVGLWIVVKHLVRNGGGTLRDLLETTTLAIRYGCLNLRAKMVARLADKAKEGETEKENGPGVKAEGTVV